MSGLESVWVVRDPRGSVLGCSFRAPKCATEDALLHVGSTSRARMEPLCKKIAADISSDRYEADGYTLQRLPLATPEMVAVVETSMRLRQFWFDKAPKNQAFGEWYATSRDDYQRALDAHTDAVRALESARGVVKQSLTTDAARAAGGKDG